jgi:hypothetical protein
VRLETLPPADQPNVKRTRAPAAKWTEAENVRLFELIQQHGLDNESIARDLEPMRPQTSAKAVKSHRHKFSDITLCTIWEKNQARNQANNS